MAMTLASIQHGIEAKPPRILLYGVQGCGKSLFAAHAPYPIFIQTEDGVGNLDVPRFPIAKSYDDVISSIQALCNEDHPYKTVVIDSLDWFEPMVWAKLVQMSSGSSGKKAITAIEDFGYGKGYVMALDYWRDYIEGINYLRNERDMMVIQIAHSDLKRFESPESDSYDRYVVKLHKGASGLLQEHSDCVFFCNYRVGTTTEKVGFDQTRTRAVGSGQRVLFTQERPAYAAKNRYGLPESIPLDKDGKQWVTLTEYIPFLQKFTEEESSAVSEQLQGEETVPSTDKTGA